MAERKAAFLTFERGYMMWLEPEGGQQKGIILAWRAGALSAWGGTFKDTWGGGPIGGDPSPGMHVPQRGLGAAWRDNDLKAQIGYADQAEEVAGRGDHEIVRAPDGAAVTGHVARFNNTVYHFPDGALVEAPGDPEAPTDSPVIAPAVDVTEITNWHMVLLSLQPDVEPTLLFNIADSTMTHRCYDDALDQWQTRVVLRDGWPHPVPVPDGVTILEVGSKEIAVFSDDIGDQLWAHCLAIGSRLAIAGYSRGLT